MPDARFQVAVVAAGSSCPAALAACLERERQRMLRLRDGSALSGSYCSTEGPVTELSTIFHLYCVTPIDVHPASAGRQCGFDNLSAERFDQLLLCVDQTASLLRSPDSLRLVRLRRLVCPVGDIPSSSSFNCLHSVFTVARCCYVGRHPSRSFAVGR